MSVNIWKIVVGLGVIISLLGGLNVLRKEVAWADDVEQSLSLVVIGTQLQIDTAQLENKENRKREVRKILTRDPNDVDALEEMDYLKHQIEVLRDRITTNQMKLGSGG